MQHPVPDFLRPSLVPVLGADIPAGTTGDIHLALVLVAAVRAVPDELAVFLDNLDLAVVAADLAVVAFGVQLGVEDRVLDVLQHGEDGRNVVLHVGDLDVTDGSAWA